MFTRECVLMVVSGRHSNSNCKFQLRNKHENGLSTEKGNRSKNLKRIR